MRGSVTSGGPTALAARDVPAGSDGLLMLPYFAGERTPVFDPLARGAWVGLSLQHSCGCFQILWQASSISIRFGQYQNRI